MFTHQGHVTTNNTQCHHQLPSPMPGLLVKITQLNVPMPTHPPTNNTYLGGNWKLAVSVNYLGNAWNKLLQTTTWACSPKVSTSLGAPKFTKQTPPTHPPNAHHPNKVGNWCLTRRMKHNRIYGTRKCQMQWIIKTYSLFHVLIILFIETWWMYQNIMYFQWQQQYTNEWNEHE